MDAPDWKGNRVFHDGFYWFAGVDFYSFENNVIDDGDFAPSCFIFIETDDGNHETVLKRSIG